MPSTEPNAANPQSRAFSARAAVTTAAVAVLALIAVWLAWASQGANQSLVGGPFALEDGSGKTITDQTLRGRPFLVYFGYTNCPDVCPTELARISDVLAAMGDKAVPALFITVDPERDTPKVMQDYASSFGPHVIGLSGSPQAIGAAEKAAIAPGDRLSHGREVIHALDATNNKLAVIRFSHPPIFPNHHRRHRVRAWMCEMSNFNTPRRLEQAQRALSLRQSPSRWASARKALVKRVFRIFLHQLKERILRPALETDIRAPDSRALAEAFLQQSRSSKSHGHMR